MVNIIFIINLVAFDLAWFGLIYWGNLFIPTALLMLCLHFFFISKMRVNEFCLICVVTIIGVFVDSMLQYLGVLVFPEGKIMPLWLITLWLCFASTLCHSLKFLQRSILLQGVFGALFAPISYIAGNEMNAVSFGLSVENTFATLSILWGGLLIIFFFLKSYIIHTDDRHV